MSGNELIAEFMGVKPNTSEYDKIWKYDTYWDWLMPVVEKIESMKFSVMVIGQYTRIQCPHPYKEFSTDICETKIQSVYKAVIEFIKWHNQKPKP